MGGSGKPGRAARGLATITATSTAGTTEPDQGGEQKPAPATGANQPRAVRMTVVLGPVEYDRLQDFTHEAQRATGRRGVAASEVTRLALARVLDDDALRAELLDTITREGGNRRRDSGKRTRS